MTKETRKDANESFKDSFMTKSYRTKNLQLKPKHEHFSRACFLFILQVKIFINSQATAHPPKGKNYSLSTGWRRILSNNEVELKTRCGGGAAETLFSTAFKLDRLIGEPHASFC